MLFRSDNLYTTPGKFGGGGAGTTWLVGSPQDVANSLLKYQALGISHFVLSDTPYLEEIKRQGDQLLPLLRRRPTVGASVEGRRQPALSGAK